MTRLRAGDALSAMAEATSPRARVLAAVLGLLGVGAYFTIGREAQNKLVAVEMADVETKVATDSVAQYEIAKCQGDPMQVCVQAGFVSAAWLQAKNEPQYNSWKATEKADCAKAGVPSP